MKKIAKSISALLAAVMLFGLAGCSERDPNISQSDSESTGAAFGSESVLFTSSSSSETSASSPEDWEPAVVNVEMDDQRILLPCKLGEIKNIAVDRGLTFSVKERDNGEYMTTAEFTYNGAAGTIYLDGDCSAIADLSDVVVIGIIAENVPVSYKGLTLGSSKEEIVRELGDPVEEKDGYIYYHIEPEGSVTFSLNSEDKVSNIAIFLDIR